MCYPPRQTIGTKFRSVGLCDEAIRAFRKANQIRMAIDTCVELNQVCVLFWDVYMCSPPVVLVQWDRAVQLAEEFHHEDITGLLTKYATHLMEKDEKFQAIELYQKAKHHSEAARLLGDVLSMLLFFLA